MVEAGIVTTSNQLNGAESLVHTLLGAGVDTCFANPGTSEMHFVGALDRYHRPPDAPLTADTEGMARAVSHRVRTTLDVADVGRGAAQAVQAAGAVPGQVAALILPADASWNWGGVVAPPLPPLAPPPVDAHAVDTAARILRQHDDVLARHRHVILANATPPVGFFAYPDRPSRQTAPEAQIHVLSRPDQDAVAALQALADALDTPEAAIPDPGPRPEAPSGAATEEGLARLLAAVMPEGAIVSNESISFGRDFYRFTDAAPAHDWLNLAGGTIGDGLPASTRAAVVGGRTGG